MLRRALLTGILAVGLLTTYTHAANPPTVILITLDSVRADRMGFLGGHHGLTPNLDALAKQSLVFERAYAQAPGTVVSHATLLSGTYPQTNRASEFGGPLAAGIPYLPDSLREAGYQTAAFAGSVLLDPRNGFAQGFDRGFTDYNASFPPPVGGTPSGERLAAMIVARAESWIARQSGHSVFVWLHFADAHSATGASYDRTVAADDAALGKLLAALRTQKLLDDSLIVVTSDHGQALGAHGEDTHGIFLYDETIHVPLLVKLPQQQLGGKRVTGRVRLVDVAPTVLEAVGIPVPSQMQGQSLLRIARTSSAADQAVYSRSDLSQQAFGWSVLESWRAGKYLYIRAPRPELYDLSADPGVTHNLASSSKAILDTIAAQLQAFDAHMAGSKNSTSGLSSSEAQKLASLGYVGLEHSGGAVNAASAGTDPKDEIAFANQAIAAEGALRQGKTDAASAAFEKIAAQQPNAFLPQLGLGAALAARQQYKTAIEHLHKAIELQPNSGWAHFKMGACLAKTGDFKTAAVHLELATTRLPEFSEAHRLLAESYEKLGRTREAQAERQREAALASSVR
jgi:arylsulfatase A-like enzyme/Tfp pilus assembly protein PilF